MNRISEWTRPIKQQYKYALSHLKTDWTLNSYPIEYRQQEMPDLKDTNLTMFPWDARIIGWVHMSGGGHTKEEAYLRLKDRFEEYKADHADLPRPGTKVAIQFASGARMDSVEEEAAVFFTRILDMDYDQMFISDESSLYDFCWTDDELRATRQKIQEVYGCDASEVEGYTIVGILERIKRTERK